MIKSRKFCKYFFLGLLIFSSAFVFSRSAKKDKKSAENVESVENSKNITEETKKTSKSKSKSKKSSKKTKAKKEEIEKSKEENNSEDIENSSNKNFSAFSQKKTSKTIGNVEFSFNGKFGTYNLSVLDGKANPVSVMETYDEGVSSFFSLLIGNNEYKLCDKTGISVAARTTEFGGQLLYVVQKMASVVVDFTAIKSDSKNDEDVVQVEISVENLTKRTNSYALKTVLDTVLGEKYSQHFFSNGQIMNQSVQLKNFDFVKSVISKNQNASMEIIFSGADCTEPEIFSLANKDVFNLSGWVPNSGNNKPFDSVFSYNNSAACIIWPAVRIPSGESRTFKFYIALSAGEDNLPTEKFLKRFEKADEVNKVENSVNNQIPEENKSNGNEKILNKIDEIENREVADNSKPVEVKNNSDKKIVTNSNKIKKPISKSQLNPDYIQKLIEKIESLDPNSQIEKNEFILLNDELDSIIKALENENASR